jgi:hypothetical protein
MRRVAAMVAMAVLALGVPTAHSAPPEELPNLVPLPLYDLDVEKAEDDPDLPALRFAMATANRGDYALDLFAEPAGPGEATAHQCVDWATDRVCAGRQEVGRFVWHAEHAHHHLEDFALYELRRFRRNGVPDMSRAGLVATSGKVSFCIIDVEYDDESEQPSPLYWLPHPLYYSCIVGAGFQGISPGWRDVYTRGTPGQEIVLAGVAPGTYALVVTTDPEDRLLETDESDNVAVTGVEILPGPRIKVVCASRSGRLRCR